MENSTRNKLKIAFTLCRYGNDCFLGALFIGLVWILLLFLDKTTSKSIAFVAVGFIFIGFVFFIVGRVIIGLESRKIAFMTDRVPTEEESWLVSNLNSIERQAMDINLANQISKHTNMLADDILAYGNSKSVNSRFMNIGKIYMGTNFIVNRLVLIVSLVVCAIILLTNL